MILKKKSLKGIHYLYYKIIHAFITIADISHHFEKLESAIREKLIPALIGRSISDIERRILALPVRLGGMGIVDPTQSSHEYNASTRITENLTAIIYNQEADFTNYNSERVKQVVAVAKAGQPF